MSEPFRDELAAAHAKIAELEKQISDLQPRRPEPPRKLSKEAERRNALVSFAIYTGFIMVACAIAFFMWRR